MDTEIPIDRCRLLSDRVVGRGDERFALEPAQQQLDRASARSIAVQATEHLADIGEPRADRDLLGEDSALPRSHWARSIPASRSVNDAGGRSRRYARAISPNRSSPTAASSLG